MNRSDKLQNIVRLLPSLGVNVKKAKSRFDVISILLTTETVTQELK